MVATYGYLYNFRCKKCGIITSREPIEYCPNCPRPFRITLAMKKALGTKGLVLQWRGLTVHWDDVGLYTGRIIPWWLGFCYYRPWDCRRVLAPIPLNLLLRFSYRLYWAVKLGRWKYEKGYCKLDLDIKSLADKHRTRIIADYLREQEEKCKT